MTMLHEEKPVLDENLLEHFGVKGMHWGVRKARPSADAIRGARGSVATQKRKVEAAGNKVYRTGQNTQARKAAEKIHGQLRLAYLNNPDRATAARLTNGEKTVAAIFAASGVGVLPVAGVVAGTYAHRKVIESRQARGYYTQQAKKAKTGG